MTNHIDKELRDTQAKAKARVTVSITTDDGELLEQEVLLAYEGTDIILAADIAECLARRFDIQSR